MSTSCPHSLLGRQFHTIGTQWFLLMHRYHQKLSKIMFVVKWAQRRLRLDPWNLLATVSCPHPENYRKLLLQPWPGTHGARSKWTSLVHWCPESYIIYISPHIRCMSSYDEEFLSKLRVLQICWRDVSDHLLNSHQLSLFELGPMLLHCILSNKQGFTGSLYRQSTAGCAVWALH